MALHGVTWRYMALHGVTWCYMVLHGVTWRHVPLCAVTCCTRCTRQERRALKLAAKLKHSVALKMKKPSPGQERLLQELADKLDANPNFFRWIVTICNDM